MPGLNNSVCPSNYGRTSESKDAGEAFAVKFHFPYRYDLDGLRAIAVLAVVIYHLGVGGLPGGFVGVDVFFVLSGFLITSVIAHDSANGKFTFGRFFKRRIARILPASALVLLVVLLLSYVLYSPQDFASTGAVAASSAACVTNIKLLFQGNYFEASVDAQPLLHYWSLSVEEQFYFIYPFLLVPLLKFRRFPVSIMLIIAVTMLSFIACVYVTFWKQTYAFYLLPTRAWELLAGAVLALGTVSVSNGSIPALRFFLRATQSRIVCSLTQATGLVFIAGSIGVLHDGVRFPGWVASLPVVGSLLVIIGGTTGQGITYRVLSWRPLVTIGKLSYSIYLWHWPIFCFVDYSWFDTSAGYRFVWKVAGCAIASIFSYTLIETPCRNFLKSLHGWKIAFGSVTVLSAIFLIGLASNQRNYVTASRATLKSGGVELTKKVNGPRVVVIGDSNASMYGVSLRKISNDLGLHSNLLSVTGQDTLAGSQIFEDTSFYINATRPDVVIFAAAWSRICKGNPNRIDESVRELLNAGNDIVLITQPPILPEYASRSQRRRSGPREIYEDPAGRNERISLNRHILQLARTHERVHALNIEMIFTRSNGEVVFIDESGHQLWHDGTHLSGYGSQLIEEPLKDMLKHILLIRQ